MMCTENHHKTKSGLELIENKLNDWIFHRLNDWIFHRDMMMTKSGVFVVATLLKLKIKLTLN